MSEQPAATEFLVVGRVRNAHGLRGELAVESLTDEPDAVFASGRRLFVGRPDEQPGPGAEVHVVHATPFKRGFIVQLDAVRDRTTAELWRDRLLLLPVAELSPPGEGELYLYELPGMLVELPDGTPVGQVIGSYELPQGLVVDVNRRTGGTVLIPFNERIVTHVDRAGRRLVVDPPAGLLD